MDAETLNKLRSDPLVLCRILWPHVEFYDKQREVIYSVRDNDETIVTAGHKLGKDFVTAFIILCITHVASSQPVSRTII
jgi:hypothetical protein